MTKISIIGAGRLGSLSGYHLMARRLADEIVLIDIMADRAEGEAIDLGHCTSAIGRTKIIGSDDYSLTAESDVIVITAGIPRKPGDTRLDLAKKNKKIMEEVLAKISEHNSDYILLMVSNPVDVLTYLAYKKSGLDAKKVLGLGTMLDTMRLRSQLCSVFDLEPQKLDALMLGEHGDSMFPAYSFATYDGGKLSKVDGISETKLAEVFEGVKDSAMQVIKKKGATFYAPTLAIAEVVDCIIGDSKRTLPVSTYNETYGVCISVPTIVGADGVSDVDYSLDEAEKKLLENSASVLKASIGALEL